MDKTPLGITYTIPEGTSATGVYQASGGIEAFETDAPYLAGGSSALMAPMPVFDAGGPVFTDSMGNVYQSLPISGGEPEPDGITWDDNTPWDNNTHWS